MSAPSARTTGEGWMVFAGVLFLLLGLFNLMWAIAAFASDDDFAVDELLFGDLTLWGILFLVVRRGAARGRVADRDAEPVGPRRSASGSPACRPRSRCSPSVRGRCGRPPSLVLDVLVLYGLAVHGDDPA